MAHEVAFLMPSQEYTYLNSTLVKEVARLGGSVRGLVPERVERRLLVALEQARSGVETRSAPGADLRRGAPRARAAVRHRGRG